MRPKYWSVNPRRALLLSEIGGMIPRTDESDGSSKPVPGMGWINEMLSLPEVMISSTLPSPSLSDLVLTPKSSIEQ